MMKAKRFFSTISWALIASVMFFSACTEKDDFQSEPTATSVIISGKVFSAHEEPLANVPLSFDYENSRWLGPRHVIHKAKTTTDRQGRYRFFFEPEAWIDQAEISQQYDFLVDLSGLDAEKYLLPSAFSQSDDVYTLTSYDPLAQGEVLEKNIYIPRKKMVDVVFRHFAVGEELVLVNRFRYGTDREQMQTQFNITEAGDYTLSIPCAAGEENEITVMSLASNYTNTITVIPDNAMVEPLVFDNKEAVDQAKFKLRLHSHEPLMKEEAGSQIAPFDFLTFRIVPASGADNINMDSDCSRYRYYDSIVWSCPVLPHTFKVYEAETNRYGSEEKFTFQWGSHFFKEGKFVNYLKGYKLGKVVYADSLTLDIKNRDFLCFDWKNGKMAEPGATAIGVYCRLDTSAEFLVTPTRSINDVPYVEMTMKLNLPFVNDYPVSWVRDRLDKFLKEMMGERIRLDAGLVAGKFKCLSEGVEIGSYFEDDKPRAVVLHQLPTDTAVEDYFVHAEPVD